MGKKALIVISETAMRDFLSKQLSRLGFECEAVSTVKESRAVLRVSEPDLIIVNSKLAGEDGNTLVNYVKSAQQEVTPMIMLSYQESEINDHRVEFLQRPIRISELRSAVKRSMNGGDKHDT
jgi:DNA-binding response OmpR family regulator